MDPNGPQEIVVLTTGGTIEKSYDEAAGSLENRESRLKERILSRLRLPHTRLRVFSILNKDSLDITDEERELLVAAVRRQAEGGTPVVVLHGTDTMVASAELCLEKITEFSVPIVFTGAMSPMGFEDSDAAQNVTEALLAAKLLSAGVYVCFHNRVFNVPGVAKNPRLRTFEVVA